MSKAEEMLDRMRAEGKEYLTLDDIDAMDGETNDAVALLIGKDYLVTAPRDCRPAVRLISEDERSVLLLSRELTDRMEQLRMVLSERGIASSLRMKSLATTLEFALAQLGELPPIELEGHCKCGKQEILTGVGACGKHVTREQMEERR